MPRTRTTRALAIATTFALLPLGANADLLWNWSFSAGEAFDAGTFTTTGTLGGAEAPADGRFDILDFSVSRSDLGNPLGTLSEGNYRSSVNPYFATTEGSVTLFRDESGPSTNDLPEFVSTSVSGGYEFYSPSQVFYWTPSGCGACGLLPLTVAFAEEIGLEVPEFSGYFDRVAPVGDRTADEMGRALDTLGESRELGELFALLDELDDEALADALKDLSPARLEAAGRSTLAGTRHFHDRLSRYLGDGMRGGHARHASLGGALRTVAPTALAAVTGRDEDAFAPVANPFTATGALPDVSAPGDPRWHAFVETLAGYGTEDAHGGRVGQRWWSTGLLGGADYALRPDWIVGFSGGYSFTDAADRGGDASGDVHTARVGPYLAFARAGWALDAGTSFGFHWIDQDRTTPSFGTARSEHDAWDVAAHGTFRFDWERGPFRFGPVSKLAWVHLEEDGFTESGGGVAPLRIDSSDTDSLSSTVGGHVSWTAPSPEWDVTLDFELGWVHEFLDDADTVGARFASAPGSGFRIRLPEADRDALRVGFSADIGLGERWSATVGWDALLSSHVEDHTASLRLETRF